MSESSATQETSNRDDMRTPGPTKAIVGRMLAVALFIAVGSFAVAQSVFKSQAPEVAQKTETSDSEIKQNESDTTPRLTQKPPIPETEQQSEPVKVKPTPPGDAGLTTKSDMINPISPKVDPKFSADSKPFKSSDGKPAASTSLPDFPSKPPAQPKAFGGNGFQQSKTNKPTNNPLANSIKPHASPKSSPGINKPPVSSSFGGGFSDTKPVTTAAPKQPTSKGFEPLGKPLSKVLPNQFDSAPSNAKRGNNNSLIQPKVVQPVGKQLSDSTSKPPVVPPSKTFPPQNPLGSSTRSPIVSDSLPTRSNPRMPTNRSPQTTFDTSKSLAPPSRSLEPTSRSTNPPPSSSFNESSREPIAKQTAPKELLPPIRRGQTAAQPSGQPIKNPAVNRVLQPSPAAPATQRRTSIPNSSRVGLPSQPATSFAATSKPIPSNPTVRSTTTTPKTVSGTRNLLARNSRSPVSTPASLPAGQANLTMSIPGDRKLEGIQSPSITIEKIAPREIQVNAPADFQLVVKNVGRIVANGVQINDQIPAGAELVRTDPPPTAQNGNQMSWQIGSLNPGQEKRILIQLRPTKPGEIGSVAQVSFAAQASMRTKVTRPVLSIQHTARPKILIGDAVVLDIVVKNDGDGSAKNVVIQEDVPPQLLFEQGFRELEYEIGTLNPGQSKRIQLSLRANQIGKFRNMMVATADGGLQSQHAIDMEVIAPRLAVSSDGPKRRFLKRPATHEFAVQNNGTASATNVELVARLPKGLKFDSANNQAKYDPGRHAVFWSLAELASNLSVSVQLTTTPMEPGDQSIVFETVADLEQRAETKHSMAVEHLVDVFFDIDDVVDPIEIGSETKYRVRVVNQGTKTATNVLLHLDFPNGIQPVSVDGNITPQIRGQQVQFPPITSLNPGDEIGFTVNARGTAPGDHRVAMRLETDGREINVTKQESTRVYLDR